MDEQIKNNYNRIKREVIQIIEDEKKRIKNDPNLRHLLEEDEEE